MCGMWIFNPDTLSWMNVEPKGKGPCEVEWKSCCVAGDRIVLLGKYQGDLESYPVNSQLQILDMSPSLNTLCKLAVMLYNLERSELPHNIRWELAAMTAKNRTEHTPGNNDVGTGLQLFSFKLCTRVRALVRKVFRFGSGVFVHFQGWIGCLG